MKIMDGTGSGRQAKVDSTNRLSTEAIILSEQLEAAKNGESYQIGSGVVTLTSANESAVLFVENNETKDLILTGVNITSGAMTGSSANVFLAKIYLSGTTLACGTSTSALNNNFGSSDTLCATIVAGQEGGTITNGVASGAFYIQNNEFFNTDIAWVLPKGSSVGVSVTPGASNTSFPVTVTLEGHLDRSDT